MSSVASILSGTQAGISQFARVGTSSIALLATQTAIIVDAKVTANSVIVCWGTGAANTTALVFSADIITGEGGFRIKTNAAPTTAAKDVAYAILKY
jgi:hypothetical protein